MDAGFLQEGAQTGLKRMPSGLKNKKKGHEWDLNDWRWDGNMFLATPSSNADAPSGCSSRELGRAEEGITFGVADKRRRVSSADNHEGCSNAAVTKGHHDRVAVRRGQISEEERPANATGACSSSAPSCQVDGCHADLRDGRDYHKRHKVCEVHTKSTLVRIKNVQYRFCQQCSRFHLLQEFDEGKKSCRSRLAKHNGRRRKAPAQAGNSSSENHSLTNTLLLLLRQLAGQDSGSSSEQINGPNYLVYLLKNLAAIASTQTYQDMLKNANSAAISSNAGNYVVNGFTIQEQTGPPIPGTESSAEEPPVKRYVQNFDLNDAYVAEDESRTDKIVFKLFGKEPNDFPTDLRAQILNWLSHYPSDLESYIRPGCVILTIYLRLPNWMWDQLNVDPAPWIENLISMSTHGFWETGWLYARVQDHLTLSCNGKLMLVSPWQPVIGDKHQILSVTPIAVACYSTANFSVRGFNIVQPTTKLLCIFGGEYLLQEATEILRDDTMMQQGPQCLTFSCSFHSRNGRGFIEIGLKTWKNARDATGYTPEDYARKRGHISYIQMVQNKINSRLPEAHVSVSMTSSPSTTHITEKHVGRSKSINQTAFHVEKSKNSNKQSPSCRQCVQLQHIAYRPHPNRFLSNRPAVLSLLAIAAVCVCIGLIMQSPPTVGGVRGPFDWNSLHMIREVQYMYLYIIYSYKLSSERLLILKFHCMIKHVRIF
uniref:Uncharacterized protein n=1 Tax=Avena sativa TaxID=4498 RepID=A0ACD5VIG5_AVESA